MNSRHVVQQQAEGQLKNAGLWNAANQTLDSGDRFAVIQTAGSETRAERARARSSTHPLTEAIIPDRSDIWLLSHWETLKW
jgi:hypothetical protein